MPFTPDGLFQKFLYLLLLPGFVSAVLLLLIDIARSHFAILRHRLRLPGSDASAQRAPQPAARGTDKRAA